MPTTTLKSPRNAIRDLAQAKEVFGDLAQRAIRIAKIKAVAEVRIAAIKLEAEAKMADHQAALAELEARLSDYVLGHPDEFEKPRQVVTDWGRFGRRTRPPEVVIDNAEVVIEVCRRNRWNECFEVETKILKPALKKRIEATESGIAGARLVTGTQQIDYTIARHLLDSASNAEGQS
jgi:phage host-nuclease inhibitor protein Gam